MLIIYNQRIESDNPHVLKIYKTFYSRRIKY